jgi:hypothetical protein
MDLSSLTDLPVLPVRITARALDPLQLPENSASSLRGAFGAALYQLVCVHRERSQCRGCPEEARCPYPYLFATRAEEGRDGTSGFSDLPRPYVIGGPMGETLVPPGNTLTWRVTLIGRAIEHLPYFALAWRAMGAHGIGHGRGRFEVLHVEALDLAEEPAQVLYDRETNLLHTPTTVIAASQLAASLPAGSFGSPPPIQSAAIHFRTPTLVKYESRPAPVPQFHILWRSLQRRLSMLRLAHGTGRPEVPFAESIRCAERIELTGWTAQELTWQRYSQRQARRVPMRGFVGTASYRGDLTPFLPALKLGTLVGVGDNCTFGQGHYEIEWG